MINSLHSVRYLAVPVIVVLLLFSKALADIFSTLAGLTFFAYSVKYQQWDWTKDMIVKAALSCWLFLLLIVPLFTSAPVESFFDSFAWIRFLLLYAVINYYLLDNKIMLKKAAFSLLIVMTIVCLHLIWQYTTAEHIGRLTGFLERPNIGMFCAKIGFATLALYYASIQTSRASNKLETYAIPTLGLALVVMILVSGERSAALITLFNIIIVMPLIAIKIKRYVWYSLVTPVFASVLAIMLYLSQPVIQQRIVNLNNDISHFWSSLYGQLTAAAIEIIKQHPFTGIGIKQFDVYCQALLTSGQATFCAIHPHNIYVEWAVYSGLIGLALFCFLVFTLFKYILHDINKNNVIVVALACSSVMMTLFPFMFSQSFFSNWPAIVTWLSTSMAIAAVRHTKTDWTAH